MRGPLAKAVIMTVLVAPVSLLAQSRGAMRGSLGGSRVGFHAYTAAPRLRMSLRGPSSSYRRLWAPTPSGSSLINPGQARCMFNTPYASSPYCRQFNNGYGYGVEPVYPFWMPYGGYDTSETEASPPPPAEPPQDNQLADEVGNLAAEVQMLRQGQLQQQYAAQPPAPPEPKPPKTILIFRDGHALEVQNYAIVGDTLWVLSDQSSQRVPLALLNLSATEGANESRGLEFEPPGQH